MGPSRFLTVLGPGADFYVERSGEDRSFVRWFAEASNLMNGERTVSEIQSILEAEFGAETANPEALQRLVDDLLSVGMVELA
jgi:hypothetical protein